jgi:hypothetical protein
MVEVEPLATKMRLDGRECRFNGVVVWGIGWKIFYATTCKYPSRSRQSRQSKGKRFYRNFQPIQLYPHGDESVNCPLQGHFEVQGMVMLLEAVK